MDIAPFQKLSGASSGAGLRQRHQVKPSDDSDVHIPLIDHDSLASSLPVNYISDSCSSGSFVRTEESHERYQLEDLGEIILRVSIPYKRADDVSAFDINSGLEGRYGVVTARPKIGHHLPDARLILPHGSAFLKIDKDQRNKKVTLSVSDPATCLHPLFQGQTLRQADMQQILATIRSVETVIERNVLGYSRACIDQDNEPYETVEFKKTLPS